MWTREAFDLDPTLPYGRYDCVIVRHCLWIPAHQDRVNVLPPFSTHLASFASRRNVDSLLDRRIAIVRRFLPRVSPVVSRKGFAAHPRTSSQCNRSKFGCVQTSELDTIVGVSSSRSIKYVGAVLPLCPHWAVQPHQCSRDVVIFITTACPHRHLVVAAFSEFRVSQCRVEGLLDHRRFCPGLA